MRKFVAGLLMSRSIAEIFTAQADEARRQYEKLMPHPVAGMPRPQVKRTESGWVATVPSPDFRYPPEWRVG